MRKKNKNHSCKRYYGRYSGRGARTISLTVSLALAVSLAGCGKTEAEQASVAEEGYQENVLREVLNAQIDPSHSSEAGKEETVYILADAKGSAHQVIVSEWLKNGNGDSQLKDRTSLKDIQNVKGYEKFETDEDGNLIWQADGADIYYQGTADREVPVEVKLSYRLDGKEIEPEELAGKSGKVTIRMDYENRETKQVLVGEKEEEIRVPFAMISGMILPQDTFSNIQVTNGRLLSEGNNSVVIGVAFPGLKESIRLEDLKEKASDKTKENDLDDLEIPDYIEVTADAEDFRLGMTMTVAMSDILSSINLTDSIDLSELNDSMDDLRDATDQLKDGTTDLKDGTLQLKDGAVELADGTGELDKGVLELKDGTRELFEKSGDLDEGAGKLSDGVLTLYDGAQELDSGASELKAGAGELWNGSLKLADGTGSLVSGAKALNSGAEQVSSGVNSLAAKISELKAGIGTPVTGEVKNPTTILELTHLLNNSLVGAAGGEEAYKAILAFLQTQSAQAQSKQAAAAENLSAAQSRSAQALSQLQEACQVNTQEMTVVTDVYTETESREVTVEAPVYYTTRTITEVINDDGDSDEEESGGEVSVDESVSQDSQTFTETVEFEKPVVETETVEIQSVDVENLQEKINAYQDSLEEVAVCEAEMRGYAMQAQAIEEEIVQVQAYADAQASQQMALVQAVGYGLALEQNLTGISNSLNDPNTAGKIADLVKGAGDLANGTQSALTGAEELNSGAIQLKEGLGTLNNGAGRLADGTGSLKDGAIQLKDGAAELKSGTEKLVEGTGELDDGAAELRDGVSDLLEGVLTLRDGAGDLDSGALELMDGMFEFDEEGISKLTDLFGDDVQDVTDRLRAVSDAGKAYTTFTELPEGVEGSVKFVIKTDAVK